MPGKGNGLTRKRALLWVAVGAAVCILFIVLRWAGGAAADVSTPEGRERYLNDLGWEIDLSTEEYRTVLIPEKFTGVMKDYAKMQREQGFELEKYAGKSCGQYNYELTNYPNCEDTVLVTLYIYDRTIIAGDIHTAAMNGFMHGLKMQQP